MTRILHTSLAALALMTPLYREAAEQSNAAGGDAAAPAEAKKSIVPSKYSGKYKDGGVDALAEFIKAQCTGKEGFEFPAFFTLCRKNGLAEDKVAHYESQVAEKRHGSQGRARMTLRNMLATLVRKNGKLVGLNGEETALTLPKQAVSGAAAKAQEAAAAPEPTPETPSEAATSTEAGEATE
jgi:hypothetical protein